MTLPRSGWTVVVIYALLAVAAAVIGIPTAAVGIGAAAVVTAVLFWAMYRPPRIGRRRGR